MTNISGMLLAMLLSVAGFYLGNAGYQRLGRPILAHPLLLGTLPIALTLWLADIPYERYSAASRPLAMLLGVTTVALSMPLYRNLKHVRAMGGALFLVLLMGAIVAPASAMLVAWWLGATPEVVLSLASKSVTTPFAMPVTELIGGLPGLAAAIVVVTGIFGALTGPAMLSRLGVADPRIVGFTLGLSAHAAGTARAFEAGLLCGAFASLAMGLTGLLTALFLPLFLSAAGLL